jgi:predicted enzyme related to lactoylglutathione lyase
MTEPPAAQQPTTYDAAATPAAAGSRFVWHDLMTTDVPKALEFYTALFGWTRKPFDMGPAGTYDMVYAGEVGLGGMVPLSPGDDVPAHWIGYVSVADVDAACAQVDAAGGKTCVPPTDIPTVGRFAVVEDPQGAVFSPFRGQSPEVVPPVDAPLGTVAWNELMTPDPDRAAEFYAGLTGWTVQKVDMGPMGFYYLLKQGERNVAGMMKHPEPGQARPSWTPYFAVASADESAAKAAALGATVIVPPTDIEDWGRFYMALDTTGAVFATLENKKPMGAPSA